MERELIKLIMEESIDKRSLKSCLEVIDTLKLEKINIEPIISLKGGEIMFKWIDGEDMLLLLFQDGEIIYSFNERGGKISVESLIFIIEAMGVMKLET